MANKLGRTVAEMEATISQKEYYQWVEYAEYRLWLLREAGRKNETLLDW